MKKITLFAVAALAISFTSCKKDRVCTCESTLTGGGTTKDVTTYYKVKKKDARQMCIGNQNVYTNQAGVTTTGSKTTCELK